MPGILFFHFPLSNMIKKNVFKKPAGNQRSGSFFSLFLNKSFKQGSMICPDEI